MVLLAEGGQRAAALQQYQSCRQALQTDLGVESEAGTENLYRELRATK
jgi:DNA-binding SARP family transcriptional activator